MSLYVGLLLAGLGAVLVVAGVRGRGAQVFSTVTGTSALGTTVNGAAYTSGTGTTSALGTAGSTGPSSLGSVGSVMSA